MIYLLSKLTQTKFINKSKFKLPSVDLLKKPEKKEKNNLNQNENN